MQSHLRKHSVDLGKGMKNLLPFSVCDGRRARGLGQIVSLKRTSHIVLGSPAIYFRTLLLEMYWELRMIIITRTGMKPRGRLAIWVYSILTNQWLASLYRKYIGVSEGVVREFIIDKLIIA